MYCGIALGYAKEHQTHASFVRCLLCKQEVRIASRGITTFWEHCGGIRQHRLDCLVRLRRGLALRKRDGTLMSESEADACAAMLAGENVPLVEACPNLSVIEALQTESEGRSMWGDVQEVIKTGKQKVFDCSFVLWWTPSIEIAIFRAFGIFGTGWSPPIYNILRCSAQRVK